MLEWNVFRWDFNAHKLKTLNIFSWRPVETKIKDAYLEHYAVKGNYMQFKEEVKSILMFYFWAKREHEICVGDLPWFEHNEDDVKFREQFNRWLKEAEKIDIWDQIELNWDRFIGYIVSELDRWYENEGTNV